MVDVELSSPLPTVALSADQHGIGVLLRLHDRPLGFFLHKVPPGTRVDPRALTGIIDERAPVARCRELIRRRLEANPPVATGHHCHGLTVVVCTRDRPEMLAACLHSVQRVRPPLGPGRFEILVVDNAPSDCRTRSLVSSLPDVRYVLERRPGLDFARNRAIVEARGEWLAFLDDDVEVDRGWLAGLGEALAENPDAAAVTGLVLPFEVTTVAQRRFEGRGGFRRGFTKRRYAGSARWGNPLYPCGAGIFGVGCNMAYRTAVLSELGGFDEALDTGPPLPGGGDLDMFYRVVRAGHPLVYEPRMLVLHKHRRAHQQLRRQYYTWGTGFMAFATKTYRTDPAHRRRVRGLVEWWIRDEVRQLVRALRDRDPSTPDLVLAELLGGAVGLVGGYDRSLRRTERIRRQVPA